MTVYRFHKNVAFGDRVIPRGSVQSMTLSADKASKLKEVGAISEIAGPPLSVLPGWVRRSEILAERGITTAIEFIECDSSQMAEVFNVKPTTIEKWKAHVLSFLVIKSDAKC